MTAARPAEPALALRAATAADLPALAAIHNAAAQADDTGQTETVAGLQHVLDHPEPLEAGQALAVATLGSELIGYHRLRVFDEPDGPRLYSHRGHVHPACRGLGAGTALIGRAEQSLQLAHQDLGELGEDACLSAWAYESEAGARRLLVERGYRTQRSMLEMRRRLDVPTPWLALPAGLDIRPVQPSHLRPIWLAYLEASADDLGAVLGTETAYREWLASPQWDHRLWQIAWDRDEVAGMILNYFAPDPSSVGGKLAHTEYVNVRRPWRRRDLAGALLTRSLTMFQALGATEVSLDVNEANPSGAVRLYQHHGYQAGRRMLITRRALPSL